MISSPSSTQQPPEQDDSEEKRNIRSRYSKRRAGQTPAAQATKAVLRPILKGLYYLLRAMRSHKLVSFLVLLLVLGSATAVTFYQTGQWPLGIGNDQFNFHIHGTNGGGDKVKNWLYALRAGDAETIAFLDTFVSSPPDPTSLVNQLSQPKSHLTWRNINVVGVSAESDSTVDSYVEVDMSSVGPGGPVTGYLNIHFVTVAQQGGAIIAVDVLPVRGAQG